MGYNFEGLSEKIIGAANAVHKERSMQGGLSKANPPALQTQRD